MKHIKQDVSLKVWVRSLGKDIGVGGEDKSKLFWNMVMLHIKLKLMMQAATWLLIFCPQTHPEPRGGVKMSNHTFLKVVMLHIKLKGYEHRAP